MIRAYPVSDASQDSPIGVINGRGVPQGSQLQSKKSVKEWKIRAGKWNVDSLTGRLRDM